MRANVRTRQAAAQPSEPDLCNVPCFKRGLVAQLRLSMPAAEVLSEASSLFGGMSDPMRLRILHALQDGEELCVCDVAHVLGMSVSAASHHLRKLRDLKLLKHRNDGKMAYYSVNDRLPVKLLLQALRRAS